MQTVTRCGREMYTVNEGEEYGDIPDGKIFMKRLSDGTAYFRVTIRDRRITSERFEYKEGHSSTEEAEALSDIERIITTGWIQPNPQQGEYECAYCGALAHNMRAANFPCPCDHDKSI